jgi:S-adenosylmethionine:tRNA ribosyltransferase-isomerase
METIVISREFLLKIHRHQGKIIAVGTTSVRSLESLYWLGLKISSLPVGELLHVGQWEPYKSRPLEESGQSLQNILDFMDSRGIDHLTFTTSIIIVPGYHFRLIEGMITNFHQPRSTLLLLIAAFLGPGWKEVYDYALTYNFRFLSYGDSNLFLKGVKLRQSKKG